MSDVKLFKFYQPPGKNGFDKKKSKKWCRLPVAWPPIHIISPSSIYPNISPNPESEYIFEDFFFVSCVETPFFHFKKGLSGNVSDNDC
jgi:hypothetical protein